MIPNILKSITSTEVELQLFGDDYSSADGTCVRDYVQVTDLAQAHLLSLHHIKSREKGFLEFNLGNGNGFLVMEVLSVCADVVGRDIPFSVGARRPGDPTFLIADSHKVAKDLG